MVLNLVANACDAVQEKTESLQGAEREQFSPCIWIRTLKTSDGLEVRVGDNGYGIPQDKVQKIFDPFYTTKPTDKGTGLGLSLSCDIVHKHGGSLKVEPSSAGGAEFVMHLPLEASTTAAPEDAQVPKRALRRPLQLKRR